MKPTSFENHVFQTQHLGKSKARAEGLGTAPRTRAPQGVPGHRIRAACA
jgi:hypothetical protein